jgi:adenylate kinase
LTSDSILGAPGSGKGTQCEFITKEFDCVQISTGDLLRAEIKKGDDRGKKIASFTETGGLVPDELVNPVLKDALNGCALAKKGWILDGYPRTDSNWEYLEKENIIPNCVIYVEISDELSIQRQTGRVMDQTTGKVYNTNFLPPPKDAKISQRATDADVEKAKKRLQVFDEGMKDFMRWYPNTVTIDGSKTIEEVYAQISKVLHSVLNQ